MNISDWLAWTKNNYGWYWIAGLITFVSVLIGSFCWLFQYITTLTSTPTVSQVASPIDIAEVTATLGGLLLVGAFSMEKEQEVTKDLKKIGKIILVTSASMIVSYFLMEYVRLMKNNSLTILEWIFVYVAAFFNVIGIICISCALSSLVTIVRFLK
jgi:hypothetical protein